MLRTPQAAAVLIAVSDLRPDLLVDRPADAEVLGDDVFNSTGHRPDPAGGEPTKGTVDFFGAGLQRPGDPVRDTARRGDFTLTASPAEPGVAHPLLPPSTPRGHCGDAVAGRIRHPWRPL